MYIQGSFSVFLLSHVINTSNDPSNYTHDIAWPFALKIPAQSNYY